MRTIVCLLLNVAWLGLLAWIILSYVVNFGRLPWGHPVRRIFDALSNVINPVLAPIRRVMPPVRAGSMGLDLSPLILFVAIMLLRSVVGC